MIDLETRYGTSIKISFHYLRRRHNGYLVGLSSNCRLLLWMGDRISIESIDKLVITIVIQKINRLGATNCPACYPEFSHMKWELEGGRCRAGNGSQIPSRFGRHVAKLSQVIRRRSCCAIDTLPWSRYSKACARMHELPQQYYNYLVIFRVLPPSVPRT